MYSEEVFKNIAEVSNKDLLPKNHINFLHYMKNELKIDVKCFYDIGACVLHWTRHALNVWKDSEFIVFDGFNALHDLYGINNLKYYIGVLSDVDKKVVKWWENPLWYGGNSIYRENNNSVFPEYNYELKISRTLDSLRKDFNYPQPDLIKIDVQGAELDVIKGSLETLKNTKYLILELQEIDYNLGAPKALEVINYLESIGWKLHTAKFSSNPADADYFFINSKLVNL
jgi:FkbM family methyltransferase